MIYVGDDWEPARQRVEAVAAIEGKHVPRSLEDFIRIYGEKYSDEMQIKRRAKDNNGDGSDAVHASFPVYCGYWLNHRKSVKSAKDEELTDYPFEEQLFIIEESFTILMDRQKASWQSPMNVKPKTNFERWLDKVPARYKNARTNDFNGQMDDIFKHIYNGGSLLMLGKTGTGKTHFLWALANSFGEADMLDDMKITNLQELLGNVRSHGGDWADVAVSLYGGCTWLLVDECDKVNGSENDYLIISALVDKRYSENKPTVFVANGTRKQLVEKLGEPVVSRLTASSEKGMLLELEGNDRRHN